jgi:hypothetical protein
MILRYYLPQAGTGLGSSMQAIYHADVDHLDASSRAKIMLRLLIDRLGNC